jgi:hypothetical protein
MFVCVCVCVGVFVFHADEIPPTQHLREQNNNEIKASPFINKSLDLVYMWRGGLKG